MILSSFCDLVHAESVVDLFVKQLNNALNVPKITNKTGKITKIRALDGRFSTNARLDLGTLQTHLSIASKHVQFSR